MSTNDLTRQFATSLTHYWEQSIPLWHQKIGFLVHSWPINKTFDILIKNQQGIIIVDLYDTDIELLNSSQQHTLQSYYSTQLPEIDELNKQRSTNFDFSAFDGFSNQPPPQKIQSILSSLEHGKLFRFILSQNATALISHLYKEKNNKKRGYYSIYLEIDINPNTRETIDFLSDQYLAILPPRLKLSKRFASIDHFNLRLKYLTSIIQTAYPSFTIVTAAKKIYTPAKSLGESDFFLSKLSDGIELAVDGLDKVSKFFEEDLRITENFWKDPSSVHKRRQMVLEIKHKMDFIVFPSLDKSIIDELLWLKNEAKSITQSP
jgi:hypothetical protein